MSLSVLQEEGTENLFGMGGECCDFYLKPGCLCMGFHQTLAWSRIVALYYAGMSGAPIPPEVMGLHRVFLLGRERFPPQMKVVMIDCSCNSYFLRKGIGIDWKLYKA